MKRFIPALLLGAMICSATPALAEDEENDLRFELTYTPLRVSTTDPEGVCHANMSAITVGGEGRIYRGIMFGGNYTFGGSSALDLTGVDQYGVPERIEARDPAFRDLKIYAKIPFNMEAFASSNRVVGPRPKASPFYGYVGYKNTSLTCKYPTTAANLAHVNVENSSGIGFGVGGEYFWDPIGVYGQVVYYPCMLTKNVGITDPAGGNTDGFLRVFEWDLGLRSNFKDSPIQAKLGYHFEQHQASNVKLQYDGFQIGATAEF